MFVEAHRSAETMAEFQGLLQVLEQDQTKPDLVAVRSTLRGFIER
jgi:hypothetical protein